MRHKAGVGPGARMPAFVFDNVLMAPIALPE